jgi:hypothetical protein
VFGFVSLKDYVSIFLFVLIVIIFSIVENQGIVLEMVNLESMITVKS